MSKPRKRIIRRRRMTDIGRMPLWLTDGINRASGQSTTEGMDSVLLASIGMAKVGTSDRATLHTIGKHIAYIRMMCNMDHDAGKDNGHLELWALSVQCAEIYRDLIAELNAAGVAQLGDGDAELLGAFVTVSMNYMRRHTEHESAAAWVALDDRRRLSLLVGIDPDTGKHNADDGKLEQFLDTYDRRAAA